MPTLIIASNRRHDLIISACRCASVQLQSVHSRRFLRQCKRYCWDGTSARRLCISTLPLSTLHSPKPFPLALFSKNLHQRKRLLLLMSLTRLLTPPTKTTILSTRTVPIQPDKCTLFAVTSFEHNIDVFI